MIGVLTYGSFVAYGDFADKVKHSTNASITLYNVELEDSGNYPVQVTGSNSTHHHYELRQTVYIQISDHLMTQDGSVHVKQIPNPIPGVGVRNSSKYENGQFDLPLNGAMLSGNYVCCVPLNESCLSVDNVTNGEDSIDIDSVDIRLTLLEKENEQLKIRLREATRDDIRQEKEIEQLKIGLYGLTGPCSSYNYTTIDDPRRVVAKYIGRDWICDTTITSGWYRFKLSGTNAVIPTYCVEGQSLPAISQQVNARVCSNWDNNCCWREAPITVLNCGEFYVYKLSPLPKCDSGFCVEKQP
ncbi:hypothetical protein ACOMHN_053270 [Nucella lapillus]